MIRPGVERLVAEPERLAGERVGLITNPSGVTRDLTPTIDLLYEHEAIELVRLFGPEHGIRGDRQAGVAVADSVDEKTGVPVRSLYGETRALTPEMVSGLDAVVYDMQDVGCRFYTVIYTLANALDGVAGTDTRFVVLDRPNPIAPLAEAGNRVPPEAASFVGDYELPIIHRMTVGELARYFNAEFDIGADLEVVPMEGWTRDTWYDETGLPWVPPSPNMPTLTTATLYPGTCLIEGTTLSEGRGTTKPFELIGAPWVDADVWADALAGFDLEGVGVRPAHFRPMFSKHEGERIDGVQIHVRDRDAVAPVTVGLSVLVSAFTLFPDSDWRESDDGYFIDRLAGGPAVRRRITDATPDAAPMELVAELRSGWASQLDAFVDQRARHALY